MLVQKSKSIKLDLNKAKKNGWSAFHVACKEKHDAVVDYIIANSEEFGINLYLKTKKGSTGYDLWHEKFQS